MFSVARFSLDVISFCVLFLLNLELGRRWGFMVLWLA
jgi:hypothetical protein